MCVKLWSSRIDMIYHLYMKHRKAINDQVPGKHRNSYSFFFKNWQLRIDCCLYWGGFQVDVKFTTGNLLSSVYIVCESRRQFRLIVYPIIVHEIKPHLKHVFFQKDHWFHGSAWTPIGIAFALFLFFGGGTFCGREKTLEVQPPFF